MEDKDIENIINKTLDERKKRNVAKLFRDPANAEQVFGWMIIAAALLFLTGFGIGGYIQEDRPEPSIEPIISDLGCDQLKKIFANPEISFEQQEIIQKYAVINCL